MTTRDNYIEPEWWRRRRPAAWVLALLLLVVLGLVGCTGGVRIYASDERANAPALDDETGLPPELADACAFWRIECTASSIRDTSIVVYMLPPPRTPDDAARWRHGGMTFSHGPCVRVVWSVPTAIRHELGHVLGLDDEVGDLTGNVMASPGTGYDDRVTHAQIEITQRVADRLEACP